MSTALLVPRIGKPDLECHYPVIVGEVIPGAAIDRHLAGATQTPRPSPCSA